QPLHLFVITDGTPLDPDSIRAHGKNILWITNGIHPGEPDGIDASLLLAQALLESDQLMGLTVNTVVCIVPVYNVSGAQQRNSWSRPDQNGPKEHGFRGNARNLDLNRDFTKLDSRNAQSLVSAMAYWDPDIYFEPHVSDGADHRYLMELLTTHREQLSPSMQAFQSGPLEAGLYAWMARKEIAMCPYFETRDRIPEQGLDGFYDSPRYSSGHAGLFDRIGIVSETHVLKPFRDRVNATFQLMLATLAVMNEHPQELRQARLEAKRNTAAMPTLDMNWQLDTASVEQLPWKGYKGRIEKSAVTGLDRVRYDHAAPIDTLVPWRDTFRASLNEAKPIAFIVPQQWNEVIQRLALNGVEMRTVEREVDAMVEADSISTFTTVEQPYEGHYLHKRITGVRHRLTVRLHPGDRIVPLGKATDRYVMQVLSLRAEDGFFAWNFFDAVLHQKEWFNDYTFEDAAAELLAKDPALKQALEAKKAADPAFAQDAWEQLTFVYRHSPWMEASFRRFPVLRLVEPLP
ncbi:MAG TPA: M14 family zinc carboxypeptidase, partial [Flavobacteriales bacterium]|nr:M14 family zinc carboxypeptidase [Flavobacteriales bacterium]